MMKHLTSMFVAFAVLGVAVGGASGMTSIFQQNVDNGAGEYEWIDDNWWDPNWGGGGDTFGVPHAGDEARLPTDAVIDGQAAAAGNLGISNGGVGSLTMRSGTLTLANRSSVGTGDDWSPALDGLWTMEGGTVTFDNGIYFGTSGGSAGAGGVGTLNMTGGTFIGTAGQPFMLGQNGIGGYGIVNISSGVIDLANKGLHVGHQNGHNSQCVLTISGDAVVNEHAPGGWNEGTQIWGGTYRVIGGHATIDASVFYLGGQGIPATGSSLEFQIDATGISTVNIAGNLTVKPGSFLDIQANSAANGTYTLIHSSNDPTAQLTNLTFAADANVSALMVVDVNDDGQVSGYDIRVEYTGGTVVIRQMGDVNLSGLVDDDDLSLLLANWNIGTTWGTGDLNENGTVNDDDLSLLLANWGLGGSAAPQAVPEPATLLLVALGGLALIRRRRR